MAAAVDASGSVWSIDISGGAVTRFTGAGALSANYSSPNLTAGTALAVDGSGKVWLAQGGTKNNVFALASSGSAVSSTGIARAGNISSPASITVDAAGSL